MVPLNCAAARPRHKVPVDRNPLSGEATRYLQSGLGVYALDLAAFSLLNWLAPQHYVIWTVAGRVIGAAAGFALHNHYSFAGRKEYSAGQSAVRYAVLLALNVALSAMLLNAAVKWLGLDSRWVRPIIDILIIGLAFLGSKFWVFKQVRGLE